ncbi:MAG: hypothetical protein Kow0081_4460 [Candidatus Dojkabacteria bacterium]
MYANTDLLKLVNKLKTYDRANYEQFLTYHFDGLDISREEAEMMLNEFELTKFEGMSTSEIIDGLILIAAQNIQHNIDFDKVATRLFVTDTYRKVLRFEENEDDFFNGYKVNFKRFIQKGIDIGLLKPQLRELFDLNQLADALTPELDDNYNYIGISTLRNRYGLHDRKDKIMETPQYTWMRVAMGLALKETNPTEVALSFYKKLSNKEYIPGGSTNIGSGTTFSVLSNCYLIDTEDDIHSIYDNVKYIALISKATGGIGISVTKLRAAGSKVKSNNTISTGPIPFVKVMDTALKSMSRGGKKFGAMCIYMETWHLDILDFIDLRQNNGDDYRRIRTANTAVYISDEFMKRVVNNEDWYLFNPGETPDLTELYGLEFSKRYNEYIEMANKGKMEMHKVIPARELMKRILTSLMGTSHPWLTWKDPINVRALNNNTGTIHSSNLCTEITLPQDRDNIAVCNLAYINLTAHVIPGAESIDSGVDWDRLESTVRVAMRHLDNLIDVNELPVKEAKKSDTENRAVGLGMSGFSESLELLGFAYDSKEAYDFMDKVMEFISYISIDESCNLAEERGSYSNYEGSMWSKGYVPIDTVGKLEAERAGNEWDGNVIGGSNNKDGFGAKALASTLESIKERIKVGIKNATSEESRDLLEIFNQLATILQNTLKKDEPSEVISTYRSDYFVPNEPGTGVELRQSKTVSMDWSRLRKRVKNGIRNATTLAIAPNASTGLVLGTSPGIDPRFAQIFSRQTSNGKFLDINPNLVKDLKRIGIWDKVKDLVLQNYGDISQIEEIPESLRKVYKTCFQISPYAFIEVASRAQKWIDQAISRNMYLDTRDVDEMMDIYTEAWRRGLKTTYYLHTKPRHKAEQSTVKVNKRASMNRKGFGVLANRSENQEPSGDKNDDSSATKGTVSSEVTNAISSKKQPFGFGKVESRTENSTKDIAEDQKKETKGSEDKNNTSKENQKQSERKGGGGFGFGKLIQKVRKDTMLEEKANFKKNEQLFVACPVDPAERAQCEACQ